MQIKEIYMRRALELASLAEGYTAPNPMVGAVIVDDATGKVISEGYHHKAGEPHAEVMAVRAADGRDLSKGTTMYVSLEPCSHYGKTPPCAELIIKQRIPRVVVAMEDPFPQVAGRGIKMLRDAGIEVEVGLLGEESACLNRAFLTAVSKERPYITLKWAETADGFIDQDRMAGSKPLVISTEIRRRFVHKMRSAHDAILIGGETYRKDLPSLDNRFWYGHSPRAVVVSHTANLPLDAACVTKASSSPILFCGVDAANLDHLKDYFEIFTYKESKAPLPFVLKTLKSMGIHSLLVEGGSNILQQFIDQRLYDSIDREVGVFRIGNGVKAPVIR